MSSSTIALLTAAAVALAVVIIVLIAWRLGKPKKPRCRDTVSRIRRDKPK